MSSVQTSLNLFDSDPVVRLTSIPSVTLIEADFPIEAVSLLAEKESWRKEIHRPATHTHKWWAQRLGSVFRSIIVGAVSTSSEGMSPGTLDLGALTILDPFAGSGTTLVEGQKLGARVVGRDINPVAGLVQRQALAEWDWAKLEALYKEVEADCFTKFADLYRTEDDDLVLYFFWVGVATCPDCSRSVDLFSDRAFARHANPRKHPLAHAVCPACCGISKVDLSVEGSKRCQSCGEAFSLKGAVSGRWMTCEEGHRSKVIDALAQQPLQYRLYAKLTADGRGSKTYQGITAHDLGLLEVASERLRSAKPDLPHPRGVLEAGYNTQQAIRWGFDSWDKLFNDRQLFTLGCIAESVRNLTPDSPEREALVALFSGTLEFNNMFCSYKGEGTGAVRHIFSHHILKPERVPLEANPWGSPLSSGSFSTLFKRRLQRADEYKRNPHDLELIDGKAERVFGTSARFGGRIAASYEEFARTEARALISPGDSSSTDLPPASVDLIITDPPFMDNVHYSELADFFNAWLPELRPFVGYPEEPTTRQLGEVQSTSAEEFRDAIASVWTECGRVLKQDGLMAFTFHQARTAGWVGLIEALIVAGFEVTAVQPVKAEMSVAAPKAAAKEPSNLDSIVVCRKQSGTRQRCTPQDAADLAVQRLARLQSAGINVSRTDIASVVIGSVLGLAAPKVPTDPLITELAPEAEAYAASACLVLVPETQ